MNLSLNKLRIILIVLMFSGLGGLIAVSPIGFSLLAGIVILGFVWIVAETGTHASYTIAIGRMLEGIFLSKPKPDSAKAVVSPNEVLQPSGQVRKIVPNNSEQTPNTMGHSEKDTNIVGTIEPVKKK